MTNTALHHFSRKAGLNFRHLGWCTKYRYNMMKNPEIKNLTEASIRKAAHEHGIKIHIISVMPDRIHLLASFPHGMADSRAMMLLKGRSSYIIFRNMGHIRLRYPQGHFWAAGGCAITAGYNDISTIAHYIKNQEQHHSLAVAQSHGNLTL